jgi:hypothetical protein
MYSGWRDVLLIVRPETVLRWRREGWRGLLAAALKTPAERWTPPDFSGAEGAHPTHASENRFWGQRKIQAELARLGFKVSGPHNNEVHAPRYGGKPSPGWRQFLKRHAQDIWACGFFSSVCGRPGSPIEPSEVRTHLTWTLIGAQLRAIRLYHGFFLFVLRCGVTDGAHELLSGC